MSDRDAELLVFSPHTVHNLRARGASSGLIGAITDGLELSDLHQLVPHEWTKVLDLLIRLARESLARLKDQPWDDQCFAFGR